jgi:hypothetical protein
MSSTNASETRSIVLGQLACAVIGLAAGLVPVEPRTNTFWGCNRSWLSLTPDQILIDQVQPASPASAAGLRNGDQVLSIDGASIKSASTWDQWVQQLKPEQEVQLRVKRDETELTLTAKGFEPEREAFLYYHWQLAFAGGSAVFAILLAATRPLRPLHSLWRPIALVLCGLGATAALVFDDWQYGFLLLRMSWPVDNRPFPLVQFSVCLVVSLTLIALGTWEIRRIIEISQHQD